MAVENPGFISDLNPNWPQDSDPRSEGAAHMRVTKTTLQQQFPGLDAVVNRTPDEMESLSGASGGNPLQAQIDALQAAIDAVDVSRVGDLRLSALSTAGGQDGNWLPCQGQAVSRTTYSALFAAIGVQYGVGDGSTSFNLPDLRARFPLGEGQHPQSTLRTRGELGGAEDVALTEAELAPHTHGYVEAVADTQIQAGSSNFPALPSASTTGVSGTGQGHENMPPFVVMSYWIRAQ